MIDERRPEKIKLGAESSSNSETSGCAFGLPVETFLIALGCNICPGRIALFISVLGVANREILKVLVWGVAPLIIGLGLRDLLGDPCSETFVGDCGRLAGDWSSETLKLEPEPVSAGLDCGSGNLNGDFINEAPRFDR
jgi:hypothetical protein